MPTALSLVQPRYYCRIKGCSALSQLTAKECTSVKRRVVVVKANAGAVDKTAPIPISRALPRAEGACRGGGTRPLYYTARAPRPAHAMFYIIALMRRLLCFAYLWPAVFLSEEMDQFIKKHQRKYLQHGQEPHFQI